MLQDHLFPWSHLLNFDAVYDISPSGLFCLTTTSFQNYFKTLFPLLYGWGKSQADGYTVRSETGMRLLEWALRKSDGTPTSCSARMSLSWDFVEGQSARLISPWLNTGLYRQIFYPRPPLFLIFSFQYFSTYKEGVLLFGDLTSKESHITSALGWS